MCRVYSKRIDFAGDILVIICEGSNIINTEITKTPMLRAAIHTISIDTGTKFV